MITGWALVVDGHHADSPPGAADAEEADDDRLLRLKLQQRFTPMLFGAWLAFFFLPDAALRDARLLCLPAAPVASPGRRRLQPNGVIDALHY